MLLIPPAQSPRYHCGPARLGRPRKEGRRQWEIAPEGGSVESRIQARDIYVKVTLDKNIDKTF